MAIIVEPWRIAAEGSTLEGQEPPEMLDLGTDSDLVPTGPVSYSLRAERMGPELLVRGSVSVSVRFTCSRCAESFTLAVREPSFFSEKEVADPHASMDLTPEVRESIILAFPTYPLCRNSCRGLCSRCGKNLNKGRCGCEEPAEERWSAFSRLDAMERIDHGRTKKEKIKKQDPNPKKREEGADSDR